MSIQTAPLLPGQTGPDPIFDNVPKVIPPSNGIFPSADQVRDIVESRRRRKKIIGRTFDSSTSLSDALTNPSSGDFAYVRPDRVETLSANDLARLQARGAIQSSPLLSQELELTQRQDFYDKLDPDSPVFDPEIQNPTPPAPIISPVIDPSPIEDVLPPAPIEDILPPAPIEDVFDPNPFTFDPVNLFDLLKRSNFVQPEPGMNPRNVLTDPFNLAQQQQKTSMQQQMMLAAQSPQQYAFDVGTGQQVGGIASLGVDQPQSLDALYDSIVDEKGYTGSYNSPPLTSPYTGQGPIGSLRYYTG